MAGDGPVAAMVRPDDLWFYSTADGDAEVVSTEYHGSGWLATVALADGTEVLVNTSHLDEPSKGQRGRLSLVEGHTQVVVSMGDA